MRKTITLFYFITSILISLSTLNAQSKPYSFKGQILDKETKEPIPFATIIARKSGIYRVADENGFYEFPSTKKNRDSFIEISSIGYEPTTITLKNLTEKIFLKSNVEELEEIVISGYLSPKTILEKAIKNKNNNYPTDPFNFYRYGNIIINTNDKTETDIELITKDCDYGYLSEYVISQRVEQIKWNNTNNKTAYKNSAQFFSYRQNAIRYASILHKRKFKEFDLEFVKSNHTKNDDLYIISFKTKKDKWKFTNKGYPTIYSGFIYINKENYAIVKVIENWTSNFTQDEAKKYFNDFEGNPNYNDLSKITIKEENICDYSNILNDDKYYATRYFNRTINETINSNDEKKTRTYERDSYLFDFETQNVEEIEYYEYNNKKENSLHRVSYDENYWDTFYKRKIKKRNRHYKL